MTLRSRTVKVVGKNDELRLAIPTGRTFTLDDKDLPGYLLRPDNTISREATVWVLLKWVRVEPVEPYEQIVQSRDT
mgnify:CR=1 FL=1